MILTLLLSISGLSYLGLKSHYQLVTLHSPAEFISIQKLNENQIITGSLTVNISPTVQPPSQFRVSS